MPANMQKGIVKFFIKEKKYGFITQEAGGDIFFHESNINTPVKEGDKVMYDIIDTIKGHRIAAINITIE